MLDSIKQALWGAPAYVDRWRFVPRLLLATYMYEIVRAGDWFMALHSPTTAQVTFVTTIWGAGVAWFGLYLGKPGAPHD